MDTIRQILAAIQAETGIAPTAFSSRTFTEPPVITYTAYPQGDDAVVESWRFQTRVTAESLAEAMEVDHSIRGLLVTLGDEERYDALSIRVNGGGTMEDESTGLPQILTYYDITTRS